MAQFDKYDLITLRCVLLDYMHNVKISEHYNTELTSLLLKIDYILQGTKDD